MKNGDEKPISCISRILLPAEEKYSTIHKEALAIYFSVTKFYQYLCGRKFILRTDHKPLITLFGEHKVIPRMYENRLQRWAAFLSGMKYTIEYVKGKENVVADYLSRAPLKAKPQDYEDVSYVNFTSTVGEWPVDNKEIRKYLERDDQLQKVINHVQQNKWPKNIDDSLKPFFHRRDELSIDNGVLMWGLRIIIPTVLRKKLLKELHEGHFGIVKMKMLARSFMYWPNIELDIEELVKSCSPCMLNRQAPQKCKLTPWPIETTPWRRIHIDFLGPKDGNNFFIIVDAYTKWVEAFRMHNITAEETIDKLRETFARFGLPSVMVSDNGRQLISQKMQSFFKQNGIRHITSPVANPQSNGLAENAVKTFKNKLKTLLVNNHKKETLNTLVARLLFQYRTTEHCTTKQTPSSLMFGREVRTRLTLLKEEPCSDRNDLSNQAVTEMEKSQARQRRNYRGTERNIGIGDRVIVKDYRIQNKIKWTPAKIIKKIGKSTYFCQLDIGNIWKRHTNQIIKCNYPEEKEGENRKKPIGPKIYDLMKYRPAGDSIVNQATVSQTSSDNSLANIVSSLVDNNVNDEQVFYDCDNVTNSCVLNQSDSNIANVGCKENLVDESCNGNIVDIQQEKGRPQRNKRLPSKFKEYITNVDVLDSI